VDVLIFGDTLRSPELRHEVAAPIADPFLYGEHHGQAFVVATQLEETDVRRVRPDAEFVDVEELGFDELIASGMHGDDALTEVALRACARFGIEHAAVPRTFPVAVADRLREGGVRLEVDAPRFNARRRVKTPAELEGIRRAARAAEAGATAIAALLAAAEPDGAGLLQLDDGVLTSERLQAAARDAAQANGATLDELVAAAGPQGADAHAAGTGPIPAGAPVVCDLWPRDRASGCYADFTRTFVAGADPSDDVIAWHGLCRDALARVLDAVAPGITGRELWEIACDVMEAAGHPTQRTKRPGEPLDRGAPFALGHGVGLDVHEEPAVGRSGGDALVAGDVVAIEPCLVYPGVGGVRIEETVLVTEDGCEVITRFDHELRV
jgi:Xaa-Pro aminopeptidase